MTKNLLFVYGSLLPGSNNAMSAWLDSYTLVVCKGKLAGRMYRIRNYPGVIYDESCDSYVNGVVLRFNSKDPILEVLDKYEEVGPEFSTPNEYRRIWLNVFCEDNLSRKSWVYLYNRSTVNLPRINGGSFLDFQCE